MAEGGQELDSMRKKKAWTVRTKKGLEVLVWGGEGERRRKVGAGMPPVYGSCLLFLVAGRLIVSSELAYDEEDMPTLYPPGSSEPHRRDRASENS